MRGLFFGALAFILPVLVWAADTSGSAEHRKRCQLELARMGLKVIPSGRDHDVVERLGEVAKEMQRIMFELGGRVPHHQLEFVPGGQLMALAALGRHPIPFWRDGARLVLNPNGALGVLEFVTPGCPVCKSFYRDSLDPREQVSIIQHVLGHNDFSETSMYARIRKADPIHESLALYDLMTQLYSSYDHDAVSRWYQYLESIGDLQDMVRGSFDEPESFDPSKIPGVANLPRRVVMTKDSKQGQAPYESTNFPKRSTASILQFLVKNLPAEAPQWKKDMIYHYERMQRVYGFYTSNKIMNEGWATLMMYILADHASDKTDAQMFEVMNLLKGVAGRKDVQNPYWLGLQAWLNLRARFNSRPENKNLEHKALDQKFFAYAHQIMEQYNDYDFLRMALDERWIDQQRLFLYRRAERHEQDPNLPPPIGPDGKPIPAEQKIVESLDAKRVIDVLAAQVADRRYQMPRILLEESRAFGRNVFSMVHDVTDNIPLELISAVQTLYVMTQIKESPVSLKTIHVEIHRNQGTAKVKNIRIEVSPTGKVELFDLSEGNKEYEAAGSKLLEEAVQEYIENQAGAVNTELEEWDRERLQPAIAQAVQVATSGLMSLVSHSPTVAKAVLEYANLVERRLAGALLKVAQGKAPLKQTKTGVRVSVLPKIPEFRLDFRTMQMLKQLNGSEILRLSGLSESSPLPPYMYQLGIEELPTVDVGQSRKRPRTKERFWGPPSDGAGEGDPKKPGEEEGDPTEIEIPLEVYSKFLLNAIELPNLRPKSGKIPTKDTILESSIRRPFGDVLYTRMMPNILALGAAAFKRQGIDPKTKSPQELAREGFKYVRQSDYIVRDREEVNLPDINAIVILLMDESGSMMGWPVETSKKFLFNLRAALLTKYKNVEFRYISMDTAAVVHTDMNKFFKSFKGGGTDYNSGFKKASEVFEDFPRAKWDRYVIGIGDSEDMFRPETAKSAEELYEMLEYFAYIHVVLDPTRSPYGDFHPFIKNLLEGKPYGGYAEMTEAPNSDLEVLMKLFGKKKKGER